MKNKQTAEKLLYHLTLPSRIWASLYEKEKLDRRERKRHIATLALFLCICAITLSIITVFGRNHTNVEIPKAPKRYNIPEYVSTMPSHIKEELKGKEEFKSKFSFIETLPEAVDKAIYNIIRQFSPTFAYDVSSHTSEELIAKIDELDYKEFSYSYGENCYNENPKIFPKTIDSEDVARTYIDLYNSGLWSGWRTHALDFATEVFISNENLVINGERTGLRSNRGILIDIAKELYFRGVWDAPEVTFGNHTFAISQRSGILLVDGSMAESQIPIDLPDNSSGILDSTYEYIEGKGLYGIVNQRLVRFLKGEIQYLPGGKLKLSGIDFSKEKICEMSLRYTSESAYNKFFLFVTTYPKDAPLAPDEAIYRAAVDDLDILQDYFYEIPDPDVSKVKLIAKLSNLDWRGSSSSASGTILDEIRYCDSHGKWYLLTENGFVRCANPYNY